MTRDEAKALLPIIQAWADGRDIQVECDRGWYDAEDPSFVGNHYRIKPKPREWWLVPEMGTVLPCDKVTSTRESWIRVREVLE